VRVLVLLAAAAMAFIAGPAASQVEEDAVASHVNPGCEILPPAVQQASVYSGYSGSHMCAAGLSPLWRGIIFEISGAPDVFPVTRFTFTDGHAFFWRSMQVTELPGGTGMMKIVGGGFVERSIRSEWRDIALRERRLSQEQMARLNALTADTGTFDHNIGTWDLQEGGMEIFLHCQLLEMERLASRDYRFSSVNIGCNRPTKLMPLVDELIRLADIGMVRDGWAGRPSP
jgi:hypothetical protein